MLINIYVAYATPEQQLEIPLTIKDGATVIMAIQQSGILEHFTDIDLSTVIVGIFGRKVTLDALPKSGDRIEIYRPLQIDPKEIRRLRAQRKS